MKSITTTADRGSTKTAWLATSASGETLRLETPGINPFHMDAPAIEAAVHSAPALTALAPEVIALRFYGAGCCGAGLAVVREALDRLFPHAARVAVGSDLDGAARALFGRGSGVACILGTGSNSGLYIDGEPAAHVPPLGYILGDEGSGAVLGRRLVGDVLKGQLPPALRADFEASYGLTADEIVRRVYRQPLPARFLAGFAPFLHRHRHEPPVAALLGEEFDRFFARNVAAYARPDLPVGFVGSIAHFFRAEVAASAARFGLRLGPVLRAPL